MTKKEIVKAISDQIGKPQTEVSVIVAHTIETIVRTLLREGRVELRDFGVFQVKCRKPRQARNPRTGLKVVVPEKYVVTFKPGKELEERIQNLDDTAAQLARGSGNRPGANEVDDDNDELDDSANLQTDDKMK